MEISQLMANYQSINFSGRWTLHLDSDNPFHWLMKFFGLNNQKSFTSEFLTGIIVMYPTNPAYSNKAESAAKNYLPQKIGLHALGELESC